MRDSFAVAVALLVTTALVGGVAGGAAGAQPTVETGDAPEIRGTGAHQADDAACSFPLTVTDATGTEITLEEPPERITTTNPSAAQTLWEIGARDRVVGVTQYAAYLDGAGERTNVSAAGLGVDVEKVVGTDPDLVLAPNASADDVEPLRNADLTVYHFSEATDVDDIAEKTTTVGRLVGACDAAAETNAEMNAAVAETRNRTADLDRPAALYPLGSGFVAAGDTFIDELMTIGGVENVAAAEHEGYPQLSAEVVLELDPELILVNGPDAPIMDEEPYASTTAGREGNAVVVEVQWLNQPAPRSVIVATSTIADAVEAYEAESDDDGESETGSDDGDTEVGSDGDDESDDAGSTGTGDEAPGFGVVAAVLAVLATLAVGVSRRP
ncbi:PGF-CTERM-anchored ABC transporter substrate-binding protein [Halorubrum halodurans]|uniref:Corrinoid ABC transporter substrate-binding protein n=1 Tax=Halorubrum halodurans TaxID=1383851 RepID=A0A256IIE1_9EURY|nr:PGF-CTERM-anchored ABC transporter substrate-binding protein [Halorubrum halodurans]OYR56223.1 corrinoid ABC transporter substrate-binding protein [Halorubrum halodurans]